MKKVFDLSVRVIDHRNGGNVWYDAEKSELMKSVSANITKILKDAHQVIKEHSSSTEWEIDKLGCSVLDGTRYHLREDTTILRYVTLEKNKITVDYMIKDAEPQSEDEEFPF